MIVEIIELAQTTHLLPRSELGQYLPATLAPAFERDEMAIRYEVFDDGAETKSPIKIFGSVIPQSGYRMEYPGGDNGVNLPPQTNMESQSGIVMLRQTDQEVSPLWYTLGDTSHTDRAVLVEVQARFYVGFKPVTFSLQVGVGGYTVYWPANFRFNIVSWAPIRRPQMSDVMDVSITLDLAAQFARYHHLTYHWTAARRPF